MNPYVILADALPARSEVNVDQRYWIGFNRIKGIGAMRFRRLLDTFGDLQTAWNASPAALRDAGLDRRAIENLVAARSQLDLDAELRRLEQSGAQVLTWEDPGYPRNLREYRPAAPGTVCQGRSAAGR